MKAYNHRNTNSIFNLHEYYKKEDADIEIARLKAAIERKDEAIGYCSNQIICAVSYLKYGYPLKADKNLNSGLSAIQDALSEVKE